QAIAIASVFAYLVRVADGTGIEVDYLSLLPRLVVAREREPLPRPDRGAWPTVPLRIAPSVRPGTDENIEAVGASVFSPASALTAKDRALIASAAARHLCDSLGP